MGIVLTVVAVLVGGFIALVVGSIGALIHPAIGITLAVCVILCSPFAGIGMAMHEYEKDCRKAEENAARRKLRLTIDIQVQAPRQNAAT